MTYVPFPFRLQCKCTSVNERTFADWFPISKKMENAPNSRMKFVTYSRVDGSDRADATRVGFSLWGQRLWCVCHSIPVEAEHTAWRCDARSTRVSRYEQLWWCRVLNYHIFKQHKCALCLRTHSTYKLYFIKSQNKLIYTLFTSHRR